MHWPLVCQSQKHKSQIMDWKESNGLFQKRKTFLTRPSPHFTLIPGHSKKITGSRLEASPNCVTPFRNFKYITPKTNTPGNFTRFFLNYPWKFHVWKFHLLFLKYCWKFHILNRLPLHLFGFFSGTPYYL